jgi:hypothetical protein
MLGGCFADLVQRWWFCGGFGGCGRCCSGGDSLEVMKWCSGGEVLMWWRLDLASSVFGWCRVSVFSMMSWFSDRFTNLLKFAGFLLSLCWYPNWLRFAGFSCIWLISTVSVWTVWGCLRAETHLPRFSFYRCSINFWLMELLWDYDGPSTFDSSSVVNVYWCLYGSDWCLRW